MLGTESGKVFLFAPYLSKSVTITFIPLLEELARRGHQVNQPAINFINIFMQEFLPIF